MTIAEQIKEARAQSGLTQQQVADALGMSIVTYKKVETGKSWTKESTLVTLAGILKITFIIKG
jgi:transcriptional regulator with XRE-family HTH domain